MARVSTPIVNRSSLTGSGRKRTPSEQGRYVLEKGKRGERDNRDLLREHGYEAHRGQQHAGGPESPDVIHDIPGVHVETKFVEGNDPYRWIRQAVSNCGDRVPVVFHRRKYKEWLVVMRAEDFLRTFAPPPAGEW